MADPSFINLTTHELMRIGRSGVRALAEIAKTHGVTTEAVKRSIWHAGRTGGKELSSFAVTAANRLGMKLTGDAVGAGMASSAAAGVAWGSVLGTGLVLGVVLVGGIGLYYYSTTGTSTKHGRKGPMTDEVQSDLLAENEFRGDQGDYYLDEPYGVFLAGNDVVVGQKSYWENRPLASLICWGLDHETTVKEVTDVHMVLGPFETREKAVKAFRQTIRRDTVRPSPFSAAVSAECVFSGKRHNIQNAPGI